ncbi:MFS transporter [Pseudonocardia acaciae]|uniref:MFS transporter n=1 Tax=Pseudonocardia acaciae TaxID=551276 RepID=UPI000559EA73|nr:MFS transporter [Pseudonocardia acaciae]
MDRPRLPGTLWCVVLGIFVNYLGYGAVLPFEIIYLHDGRGFGLGTAGVVVGLVTGVAVASVPLAGPLIDRFGARAVASGAGVALAAGYAGLALATSPGPALVAAAVAGAGNGALNPSQSTLVTTLAPARLRHRATAVSRVAGNVGIGIGGGVGGLVAATGLPGFVALFLANSLSYLAFAGILVAVVPADARAEPVAGGYRVVVRDRAFVRLALLNVALISVGWGVFTWLLPPFAGAELGLRPELIGLLLLANAATVAVAQVPIARIAEGRRRAVLMAVAAWLFAAACLLVLVGAYPALLAAVIAVGVGECCHTTVLMPLVADLAPDGLRGRYMAAMGLSWWVGLAIAPALGATLLGVAPEAVFLTAAGTSLAAGAYAMLLERRLPAATRLTPA